MYPSLGARNPLICGSMHVVRRLKIQGTTATESAEAGQSILGTVDEAECIGIVTLRHLNEVPEIHLISAIAKRVRYRSCSGATLSMTSRFPMLKR